MSVPDFEEQIFTYVWRGLVLAGLLTFLWSTFAPSPNGQILGQAQGATNSASSRVYSPSAAGSEAR
jgi:hypothetical protein